MHVEVRPLHSQISVCVPVTDTMTVGDLRGAAVKMLHGGWPLPPRTSPQAVGLLVPDEWHLPAPTAGALTNFIDSDDGQVEVLDEARIVSDVLSGWGSTAELFGKMPSEDLHLSFVLLPTHLIAGCKTPRKPASASTAQPQPPRRVVKVPGAASCAPTAPIVAAAVADTDGRAAELDSLFRAEADGYWEAFAETDGKVSSEQLIAVAATTLPLSISVACFAFIREAGPTAMSRSSPKVRLVPDEGGCLGPQFSSLSEEQRRLIFNRYLVLETTRLKRIQTQRLKQKVAVEVRKRWDVVRTAFWAYVSGGRPDGPSRRGPEPGHIPEPLQLPLSARQQKQLLREACPYYRSQWLESPGLRADGPPPRCDLCRAVLTDHAAMLEPLRDYQQRIVRAAARNAHTLQKEALLLDWRAQRRAAKVLAAHAAGPSSLVRSSPRRHATEKCIERLAAPSPDRCQPAAAADPSHYHKPCAQFWPKWDQNDVCQMCYQQRSQHEDIRKALEEAALRRKSQADHCKRRRRAAEVLRDPLMAWPVVLSFLPLPELLKCAAVSRHMSSAAKPLITRTMLAIQSYEGTEWRDAVVGASGMIAEALFSSSASAQPNKRLASQLLDILSDVSVLLQMPREMLTLPLRERIAHVARTIHWHDLTDDAVSGISRLRAADVTSHQSADLKSASAPSSPLSSLKLFVAFFTHLTRERHAKLFADMYLSRRAMETE